MQRPLLQAIDHGDGPPPVLLIDEVDRADDEFEAFLLEVLSDYQITIPELGTFHADVPPMVVLTSNRTRDVHDALKRRCLYHWVEHPDFEREVAIVRLRVPEVARARSPARSPPRSRRCATSSSTSRRASPRRSTGPHALAALGVSELDEARVDATLGTVLKYREDHERVAPARHRRARRARARSPGRLRRRWRRRSPASTTRPAMAVALRSRAARRRASPCPSAARVALRRGAGRARRRAGATRLLGGRATLVRRPEDIAALRPGLRRVLARRPRPAAAAEAAPDEPITLAIDDADDDAEPPSADAEPTTTTPTIDAALQPHRGAAPQGLRRLRRRRAGRGAAG